MNYKITASFFSQYALIVFCFLAFPSCSSKYAFSTSRIAPNAVGKVNVKKDDNNNYNIYMNVKGLEDAKLLIPGKVMYIVWLETTRTRLSNIGQLNTISGTSSDALERELKTVSSYRPKRFIITAEDSATVQYPGGQVILRTGPI